jgi:hypothetical protein
MSKVLAAIAIVIGGLASIFELLSAFGYDVTQGQQASISAVAGLALLVLGVWFHPSIPVGPIEPPE